MPTGSHQAPILSCDPGDQLLSLRRALAPERWPLAPSLLPADTLLVGGAVRDALLGRLREHPDLDLIVQGDAVALTRTLARRCGGSCVVLDAERSIARLVLRGWSFDLARRMGASLSEDLGRRDYSVNAIALPLACVSGDGAGEGGEGPIDPGGGLADLRDGRMRALGEANLLEDPLRLLRGVRLACELGFSIEPQTLDWIHAHHRHLADVAGERVLAELERLAAAPDGAAGLRQALSLGLLDTGQTEAQGDGHPGPELVASRLDRLTPEHAQRCGLRPEEAEWALPLARLATVLSPEALTQLRASRRLQQRCRRLGHWLQRLSEAGESPAQGPHREPLTLTGLPEGKRLALQRDLEADLPALAPQLEPGEACRVLERWRDAGDPLFHPRPPLDGRDLQRELGLPPGRTLGALLDHLSGERAFGRLAVSADPASVLQVARAWLAEADGSAANPATNGPAP